MILFLQAVLGMDILSQAKSGMGKTAVFVLATLQQIEPVDGQVTTLTGLNSFALFRTIMHGSYIGKLCSNPNFPGLCAGNVPHQGVGVPDQQGVREVQQVPACSQGEICCYFSVRRLDFLVEFPT